MMEDRLSSSLLNMGYQRLNSNTQGIYLYYRVLEQDLIIVSVFQALNGNEITLEQYSHVLEQMKGNFQKSYSQRIQLLSLVITKFPDKVKHLCSNSTGDSHWIIDLSANRLMIYETQSNDFAGLQGLLEELLDAEPRQNDGLGKPVRTVQFTLINTSIVIINVIVFLLIHFTGIFGGEEGMYTKGALSWYLVTEHKEFYRLITSMFLHADLSHLINNMIVLLFVGSNLEQAAGRLRYLFIYFGTGILAGITSIGYNMWKENGIYILGNSAVSIGASGAIFGVVGAVLFIVIINKGRLKELGIRQVIIFVALSLYGGIINSQIDQAAHVGGFLSGFILAAVLYRRPRSRISD